MNSGNKLTKMFALAMVVGLLVMLTANNREAYASCTTGKIMMKSQIPDQTFKPNMPARVTLTMRIKVFNTIDGNCGIVAMSTIPGVYIVPAYGGASSSPGGPNVWSAIHDSVVGSGSADHYARFVVIYDGSAASGTYGKIIISVGADDGAAECGPGESGDCPADPRPIMGYVNVFIESTVKEKWMTVTSTAATVSANRLILNHAYLNGNPDAKIFITHTKNLNGTHTGTLHNHPISAAYDSALARWTIQNDDLAQMPNGVSFFVRIDPSATTYTPFVCGRNSTCCVDEDAGNCSSIRIYRPGIGNPEAAIFVTAIGTIAPNPHPISVKYQSSEWHIVNSDGTSIPRNTAFNYRLFEYSPMISGTPDETDLGGDLDDSSGVGIEVSAAGGTPSRNSSSGRALGFWWQKGDPRIPVILTANQNPGGRSIIVANPKYAGVLFQGGTPSSNVSSGPACRIFNEDQTTLSVDASFNVWAPPQVW